MTAALPKTSREYWDGLWQGQARVPPIEPGDPAVVHQFDRALHAAIASAIARWGERPRSLIELGCGGSPYLPYFARHHGVNVAGLDYSDAGCARARDVLAAQRVEGTIVQGDMFDPPAELLGRFDLVFSMGLLEHFTDTPAAIAAAAAFLRPGGLMLSIIPNMTGLPGWLQRRLDCPLFDLHVPLDRGAFAAAHARAGLAPLQCAYLMTLNLYVLHYRHEASALGLIFRALRAGATRSVWWSERACGRSLPNRVTAPYVFCAARAPSPAQGAA